jgi:flagellar protein FliS
MLYDEAVKRLDHALEILELNAGGKKDPGRIEQVGKAVMKTQEILTELMVSLDFEQGGEIAKNLFSLYTWFNQELLRANIAQDYKRLLTVRGMINDLRGAWVETVAKTSSAGIGRPADGIDIAG